MSFCFVRGNNAALTFSEYAFSIDRFTIPQLRALCQLVAATMSSFRSPLVGKNAYLKRFQIPIDFPPSQRQFQPRLEIRLPRPCWVSCPSGKRGQDRLRWIVYYIEFVDVAA